VVGNDALLDELRRLSNHGFGPDPLAPSFGYNAKLSELHAAVGLHTLASFPEALARRSYYASRIRAALLGVSGAYAVQEIQMPSRPITKT